MRSARRVSAVLARISLAALTLLAMVFFGVWVWADLSAPQVAGDVSLPGLAAPVEVIRDPRGIPHVFAASAADAHIAQGFLHAQDRFAQMDAMRLMARGRLAEFVGRRALGSDRFMRGLELAARAEGIYAALAPESRAVLDAYAAGVNAFLGAAAYALPIELRVAGRKPEPWHPVDSLLWGQIMALHLGGNWRDELARARFADALDPATARLLWPDWPVDAATSLRPGPGAWSGPALDRLRAALPEGPAVPLSSNAWVLAGHRTASGAPLLANDPHLQFGAPGVWYLLRLSAPDFTRVGASAPGVPGLVLGHNGHVAWGMTTTGADSFDLFVERLHPADADRVLTPQGDMAFDRRSHDLRVRGETDPVRFSVRWTRHGVVLADIVAEGGEAAPPGHVLVLATTLFAGPNTSADALIRMNAARDVPSMLAAAQAWIAPVQNLFVADTGGAIALAAIGAVPRRKGGDGARPAPGWSGDYDWDGLIHTAALPRQVSPSSGFLMNANHRLIADGASPHITVDWDAPYRALRLQDKLGAAQEQDIATTRLQQLDHVSLHARAVIAAARRHFDPPADLAVPWRMLRGWTGEMRRDRPEPLLYHAWMRVLRERALIALLGEAALSAPPAARESPELLLAIAAGATPPCTTLDCRALLSESLEAAFRALVAAYGADPTRWRWGDAHVAAFENPVWRSIPVLGRALRIAVATDGDNFTVNRGTSRGSDPAHFPHVHGAGLRAIYDLADLDRARFAIAPGQSGHPLSPHWSDLAAPWSAGQDLEIAGTRETLRKTGRVLRLLPAS